MEYLINIREVSHMYTMHMFPFLFSIRLRISKHRIGFVENTKPDMQTNIPG